MKTKTIARLALLALLAGCGSSGDNTPDAAAAVPADDAPVTPSDSKVAQMCDHAGAICTKLAECAPFLLAAGYGDLPTCAARLASVCTEQSKSTGSGMTLASVLACEAALAVASCNDVYANRLPACAFRGSFPDGATCGDHTQCSSGFCSRAGNLCGVCTAKVGNSGACPTGNNDECQSGLVCSSGKLCVPPVAVGAACDDATAPCLTGSFCTAAKTCALTVAVGEKCPGTYLNLANGTLCWAKDAPSSPQLAIQLGAAGKGEPCGLNPGNGAPATLCAPGGVPGCTPTTGSIDLLGMPTQGQCAAPREDGFTCSTSTACMTGALCINGTCQIPSGRYCGGLDGGSP